MNNLSVCGHQLCQLSIQKTYYISFACLTILLGYTIDKLAYLEHNKGKLNVDQQSFEQLSIDFTDDQSKMVLFSGDFNLA